MAYLRIPFFLLWPVLYGVALFLLHLLAFLDEGGMARLKREDLILKDEIQSLLTSAKSDARAAI